MIRKSTSEDDKRRRRRKRRAQKKKEGHGGVDTGDDEVAAGARWISVLGPEHCCCCVGPERDAAKRPLRLRGRTGREVNLR